MNPKQVVLIEEVYGGAHLTPYRYDRVHGEKCWPVRLSVKPVECPTPGYHTPWINLITNTKPSAGVFVIQSVNRWEHMYDPYYILCEEEEN
jgi:hypothetical protein